MSYGITDVCRHVINYSNERDYDVSDLKLHFYNDSLKF